MWKNIPYIWIVREKYPKISVSHRHRCMRCLLRCTVPGSGYSLDSERGRRPKQKQNIHTVQRSSVFNRLSLHPMPLSLHPIHPTRLGHALLAKPRRVDAFPRTLGGLKGNEVWFSESESTVHVSWTKKDWTRLDCCFVVFAASCG